MALEYERQTKIETLAVHTLLQLARAGRLRVPAFQRPPRWKARHVIELFDSMREGYPIGTLLLGQREAPAHTETFGRVQIAGAAMSDALWVVDGQQRVAAIVGALLHPDAAPRGDVHAIWYDLDTANFVHGRRELSPVHVPLCALGDPDATYAWVDQWPLRKERRELISKVHGLAATLLNFQVSVAIVRGDDETRLREIFRRLNNTGVRMQSTEVFNALFRHLPQGDLEAAAARVSGLGYGTVSQDTFLRCMLAAEGLDPGSGIDRLSRDEVPAMAGRTHEALACALDFLSADAEVPHLALLPYPALPMRVLARYFVRFARPGPRARTLLRRWFWRGCGGSGFTSSSQGLVRRLQQCIDAAPDAEGAAQALLEELGAYRPEGPVSATETWRARNARSRLVALALLGLSPPDPAGLGAMDAAWVRDRLRGAVEDDDALPEAMAVLSDDDQEVQPRPLSSLFEMVEAPDDDQEVKPRPLSSLFVDVCGVSESPLLVRRVWASAALPALWWRALDGDGRAAHGLDDDCITALDAWYAASDDGLRQAALNRFDTARAAVLTQIVVRYLDERTDRDAPEGDRLSISVLLQRANAA